MGTPRLFGGAKGDGRCAANDAFDEIEDTRRRAIQCALLPGFAQRIASRIGRSAAWVYRRIEGKAPISAFLEWELLRELPPDISVRRLREDAARLGFAVAQIPGARGLQPAPVSMLAESLRRQARACESAINALVDAVVTAEEVEAVREDADAATVLTSNAVATLEVAAGRRLL